MYVLLGLRTYHFNFPNDSGIIDPSTPIAPLLEQSNYPVINASQKHFSTFPLTSHLHSPALRLVSLHAALSLSLSFARVPEIHDGFVWTVYYARNTIVEDVIRSVVEDLGLVKSLPMAGGGNLEYIIQDGSEGDVLFSNVLLTYDIVYFFISFENLILISIVRPHAIVFGKFPPDAYIAVLRTRGMVPSPTSSFTILRTAF